MFIEMNILVVMGGISYKRMKCCFTIFYVICIGKTIGKFFIKQKIHTFCIWYLRLFKKALFLVNLTIFKSSLPQ